MKNFIKVSFILVAAFLYGCNTDYTKQVAGTYMPYNEKNDLLNENAILKLKPNGSFVYEVKKLIVFQGTWEAAELKEMTTVNFHSKNREWKSNGGSFNPPQCDQIIVWNPQYFNLPDSSRVIFKKK